MKLNSQTFHRKTIPINFSIFETNYLTFSILHLGKFLIFVSHRVLWLHSMSISTLRSGSQPLTVPVEQPLSLGVMSSQDEVRMHHYGNFTVVRFSTLLLSWRLVMAFPCKPFVIVNVLNPVAFGETMQLSCQFCRNCYGFRKNFLCAAERTQSGKVWRTTCFCINEHWR